MSAAALPLWTEGDRVIVTYATLQTRNDGGLDELRTTYPASFVRYEGEDRIWAIVRNQLRHELRVAAASLSVDDPTAPGPCAIGAEAPMGSASWLASTAGLAKALNALRDLCHANSRAHGFHDKDQPLPEAIALMHSELSEALEDHRAGEAPNHVWFTHKDHDGPSMRVDAPEDGSHPTFRGTLMKPCGIPSEFADVIVRVMDTCGLRQIDIGTAVVQKMAYNVTRPYKHNKSY